MTFANFPAARYRLDFTVESPMPMREYAGSALRGAFGAALRRTVCVTRQPDCKTCALYRSCVFPAVFAPPAPANHAAQKFSDIPAPYVIEPPAWGERHYAPGETFRFHFVLIGHALKHLPLILHAWQRAFLRGVGPGDGTASLRRVSQVLAQGERIIYQAETGHVAEHDAVLPPAPPASDSVSLDFVTQVRLQHHGKPLSVDTITPHRLLMGLLKRTALIAEFHTGTPLAADFAALAEAARHITDSRQLVWRDWTRYSSRQKQEMQLGGVIGQWTLTGDLTPFWPLLHLGQWLHVGKNASFGLGQYRMT